MDLEQQLTSLSYFNIQTWESEESKKILIVDDDAEFRSILTEYLEHQGYTVISASCGQEALRLINTDTDDLPSLILLDYLMPSEDGVQFHTRLKEQEKLSNIPTVMVTGYDLSNKQRQGVKGVLMKPFDWSELDHMVEHILEEG